LQWHISAIFQLKIFVHFSILQLLVEEIYSLDEKMPQSLKNVLQFFERRILLP